VKRWPWLYWLPAVGLTLLVAWASSARFSAGASAGWLSTVWAWLQLFWPTLRLETLNHLVRKTGHVCTYGTLFLCWQLAFSHSTCRRPRLTGWLLTLVIAGWDEANQSWLPERTGTPRDVLWDTAGMLLFLALQRWCAVFVKKKSIPLKSTGEA
jgi:VanZ family protein